MNRPRSSPEETKARMETTAKINDNTKSHRPPKKRLPPRDQDEASNESPLKRVRFDEEKVKARRASDRASTVTRRHQQTQTVAVLENLLAIERNKKELLQVEVESLREENNQLRVMMSQQQKLALNRNRTLQQLLRNHVEQSSHQTNPPQKGTATTRNIPELVRPSRSTSIPQTINPTRSSYASLPHNQESRQYPVQGQPSQGRQYPPSPQLSIRLRPPSPLPSNQEAMCQNQFQDSRVQHGHHIQYSTGPSSSTQEQSDQAPAHGFSLPHEPRVSLRNLPPPHLRDREPRPQISPLVSAIERMPVERRIQYLQQELDTIMERRAREPSP